MTELDIKSTIFMSHYIEKPQFKRSIIYSESMDGGYIMQSSSDKYLNGTLSIEHATFFQIDGNFIASTVPLKEVFTKNERGYSLVIAFNLTSICSVYKENIIKNVPFQGT